MINEFIDKTIDILKASDIAIHRPKHRDVRLNGDQITKSIHLADSCRKIPLEDNFILHNTILFSIIDSFIDVIQPDLEEKSFAGKYNGLDTGSDKGVMLKQIYRILRLLRNASVHSKKAISVRDDNVRIEYRYRDTEFKLVTSKKCLELIYSFVLIVVEQHNSPTYPPKYCTGLLRSIYDDVGAEVAVIKDNFGNNFGSLDGLRLAYHIRDKVMEPEHKVDKANQKLLVERLNLSDIERKTSTPDYYLQINGKTYLVPDECLNDDGAIAMEDLPDWEIPRGI